MYICNKCGKVFEYPKTYTERHPYGMGYAEEQWSECPSCGSGDFDEAKLCTCCQNYVAETKDGLCDVCYGDMYGVDDGE